MPDDRLRILIAEDVGLIAEAFQALLETEPGLEVVGRFGRGDQILDAVTALRPDVAVLDVDLPGMTGIEAAAAIRDESPWCKVLLLTALEGSGHLHRALTAGASGYLVKSTTADRLIEGIRTAAAGGTVIDRELAAEAVRLGPNPLTAREVECLRLVGRFMTTEEIADELYLSAGTVRNYLSRAMTKLGAQSRAAAYQRASAQGWL